MGPVHLNLSTEKENLYQNEVPGKRKKVAVLCWYTSNGKSMPYLVKYEDEDGNIQTIRDIQVIRSERKFYAGIDVHRYDCYTYIQSFRVKFVLMYHPENETWTLIIDQ